MERANPLGWDRQSHRCQWRLSVLRTLWVILSMFGVDREVTVPVERLAAA